MSDGSPMVLKMALAVGAGSFIGGVLRYLVAVGMQATLTGHFPWHTFAVNLIGCFGIGMVMGCFARGGLSNEWTLFLATGVLGGFTTFSAFSHETLALLRERHIASALLYVVGSVSLGLAATWLSYRLVVGRPGA